jgi:hypothetical protein
MPRKEFESFTRLDASDVNTYLMDQSVMTFAGTAARGSAIATPVEGMVAYLEDSNTIEAYNSTAWVTVANAGTASYNLVQTLYFTSDGTFTKATYPWLRAIRVGVQGAGAGGGGVATTTAGQVREGTGGGGGGYGSVFITDISGLDSSVTVTVGAGGDGGIATNGSNGGSSSFGAFEANGGGGGRAVGAVVNTKTRSGIGATGFSGAFDFTVNGGTEPANIQNSSVTAFPGNGGGSFFAGSSFADGTTSGKNGENASFYGQGGTGACNAASQATERTGGNGANGIVIVELYA